MDALIANARFHFHKQLFETNTLTLTTAGVASNADTSSRGSKAIARRIVDILVEEQHHAVSTVDKISGQTLGKQFETLTMEFLRETFPYLQNLRPGNWTILQLGNNNKLKTSDFAQYEHLAYLNALTTQNAQLAAALGNDYLVAPDVVVYRDLYEDSEINAAQPIVDDEICKMADIRKSNGGKPILHASVSAKYTMRSDRAQNSRTEALNLIRNRKGHLLHIVVVTAEPMPNRLASLALGTGDIDCVYHFALYELIRAVKEAGSEDAVETLIFDEIDSGISGRTAQMVSEKMNVLGRSHQIICITHLPQIAAMADSHYLIRKSVQNQTTVSTIRRLSEEESIQELSRMLGGVEITETVKESAREMRALAKSKKSGFEK